MPGRVGAMSVDPSRVSRSVCQGPETEHPGAKGDPVTRLLGAAWPDAAIPRGGGVHHLSARRARAHGRLVRQPTPDCLSRGRTFAAAADVLRRLTGIGNVQSCGRVVYVKGVTTCTNFKRFTPLGAASGTSSRHLSLGGDQLSGVHRRRLQRVTVASNLERIGAIAPSLTRHVSIDSLDEASSTEAQHVVAPS
ncbi:MAG: hypothetical protein ACPGU1_22090 [Myxococcota bacterium]